MVISSKDEQSTPDEGLDVSQATKVAIEHMRGILGHLNSLLFRIEQVKINSDETRYIIIASVVSDRLSSRDYYVIKVDRGTGKVLPPVCKGKLDGNNKFIPGTR